MFHPVTVRDLRVRTPSKPLYLVNMNEGIKFYCDNKRHIVCLPYSIENLHIMAEELGIKKCWFHKDHYDIPKRRIEEITNKCILVSPKQIVRIKNGALDE